MYVQALIVYLMISICLFWFNSSQIPYTTSVAINLSCTYGNLNIIDINLATCLLASTVHSLQNSKQLNAISIKSLFKSKCYDLSFVKITINALIRESLRCWSTASWSSGSISFTSISSFFSVSIESPVKLLCGEGD